MNNLFKFQSTSESPLIETLSSDLAHLYEEITASHPISRCGRSQINESASISYFSLCNGSYLVSQLPSRKGKPWHLYILDYTCRHYIHTGPYTRESPLKKLHSEYERKLS